MSFNLKISKMCRGGGIAYFLAELSGDIQCREAIRFHAESNDGICLPVESYEYEAGSVNATCFILATPMLNTKAVIFFACDETGKRCSNRVRLYWGQIKWMSRLNYRLDFQTASQLRDVDRYTYSSQIHINVTHYVSAPNKGESIIKGIICAPYGEKNCKIRLLDEVGQDIAISNLYMGNPLTVDYEGIPRIETSFSIRVPENEKTYCLVADGGDEFRSGFLCLDVAYREHLRESSLVCFYRVAGYWDAEERLHNRKYLLADSADYAIQNGPKFSIVVPLYNTPVRFLQDMVNSVVGQLYGNWELILVNSTPKNYELSEALQLIEDERITTIALDKNYGISRNTNYAIERATGDYIVFFDHDDVLDKLVLYRYASEIKKDESIDVLYCDEDLLTEEGKYINPCFKSDFNIDLLRAHNYITHLLCVKAELAKELKLSSEFDGAQDYDLVLRLSEITDRFVHVPEVLYHWRMSPTSTANNAGNKTYAQDAGLNALNNHLCRMGLSAEATETDALFFYRTSYSVVGNPLVSIIIPNKDAIGVLSKCIESIYEKTLYRNFEIVIVENNSVEQSTFDFYKQLENEHENIKVVFWDEGFNYSKINNYGAQFAKGEYLLLLNNDIEVISPEWLSSMLGYCQREEVGIVGPKLLYPDDTIQHAGVAMGQILNMSEAGGAMHVFNHLDKDDHGYFNRAFFSQDVSIVTGACLLVKRELFDQLNGLSDKYQVAYNDVDFCLRAREAGYLVVYDANVNLRHYESFSRGDDQHGKKAERFLREQSLLRADWPQYYLNGDPYFGKWFNR